MFYHGPQPNDDSRARNHLRVFTININPEKTGYSIYSYIYTLYVIKLFWLGWFMALGLPVKTSAKAAGGIWGPHHILHWRTSMNQAAL